MSLNSTKAMIVQHFECTLLRGQTILVDTTSRRSSKTFPSLLLLWRQLLLFCNARTSPPLRPVPIPCIQLNSAYFIHILLVDVYSLNMTSSHRGQLSRCWPGNVQHWHDRQRQTARALTHSNFLFRRNLRLDLTDGSNPKHLISTSSYIYSQPQLSTKYWTMLASLAPCQFRAFVRNALSTK